MTAQFEFRLMGTRVPEGQLDAEKLLALVRGLQDVAMKIGRVETEAEPVGRAPKRVHRVASLLIGLQPGSTRLLVGRAGAGEHALAIDLADEVAFDETFAALVASIARDVRPEWVGDSLAVAAADLTSALREAASAVEFSVDGELRHTFQTAGIHRRTWHLEQGPKLDQVTFVGRLFAVNLNTHRLQVQDDAGNQVALPKVLDDDLAARLLRSYVLVTGSPELDSQGRLTHIHDASIEKAPDPLNSSGSGATAHVSIDAILAGAPGIEHGGIEGLTDAEASAFFEAMGI